jgi:uncharacterized SAM-binding protein YcdF (DUF218 family)
MTLLGSIYAWIHLGSWLAAADKPQPAEVIVCLGGPERIRKGVELFHKGLAPRIILTVAGDRGPLKIQGIPEDRIILVPGPKTTYQEALLVAPILKSLQCRSALIVSDAFHLRRVRWTFRHVLNQESIRLSFVASDLPWHGKEWWRGHQEKYRVYSEISKIGYYRLVHGIMGISEEPLWIINLKRKYEDWLRGVFS